MASPWGFDVATARTTAGDRHGARTQTDAVQVPVSSDPQLVVIWEGGFVRRTLDAGGFTVVGRGDECDIQIVHASMSRRHLRVHSGPPSLLEDLGSRNGVRVRGRRLDPKTAVAFGPGDVAEAGPALVLIQGDEAVAGDSNAPVAMAEVKRLLALVAKSELSVILIGETGVGKEVAAEAVHASSQRAAKRLVRLNCAGFNESLLEAELFGYERGAFTGAVNAKAGLLESANGGTVFLDEIAEMPLPMQAKLLRVLESREVLRIGSVDPIPIDVRFVSATHRDLRGLVRQGSFREDLYYRLNGMTVRIPSLRERREEIPELVTAFVSRYAKAMKRRPLVVDPRVIRLLQAHSWPGNIRELRNVVERAVALAAGDAIGPEQLVLDQPMAVAEGAAASLNADVDAYERARLLEALERAGGNQTKAARLLGLSRRALIGRIESHNLPRPRKR
jgi:DNA-binding NtrC family response regulator